MSPLTPQIAELSDAQAKRVLVYSHDTFGLGNTTVKCWIRN